MISCRNNDVLLIWFLIHILQCQLHQCFYWLPTFGENVSVINFNYSYFYPKSALLSKTIKYKKLHSIKNVSFSITMVNVRAKTLLCLLLFPFRLLNLTWAKGPGNNTLTPALSDSSWPGAASSASRWGLTLSSFYLNPVIHLLPVSLFSHFLMMLPTAQFATWQQCTNT